MGAGIRGFLSAALVLVGLSSAAGAPDRGAASMARDLNVDRRVALVIGNGNYRNAPPLPNPANDAEDMAALLNTLGFEVVVGIDEERSGMERRVRDFAERTAGAAVALFYYAGHGVQVDGRNYLVPVDAALDTPAALDFEMMEVDRVLRHMVGGNRIAIALLDACRDNPIARHAAATRSAAVGRGLAMPTMGGGLMIGFATAPGETASDGTGRNSPFARALLDRLGTPGLEMSQAMRRVMADVSKMTGDRQRPWVHSDISDDFYMVPQEARSPDPALPTATPAVPRESRPDTPPPAIEQAPVAPSIAEAQTTFGVFPGQTFTLCGYTGFSARLSGKSVAVASRDPDIPDRGFRGFERTLASGQPVRLWENCVVTATGTRVAGMDRINFTVKQENSR